jgi:hypothetical protein
LNIIGFLPGCEAFREPPDALSSAADRQQEQEDGEGNGAAPQGGSRP